MFVKLVVCDFDGVFTDGTICFDGTGRKIKSYNVKDGMAFKLLQTNHINYGIISGFPANKATKEICKHLGIPKKFISMGNSNKLETLKKWANDLNLKTSEIAYIGDDINDIECINFVGISGCPANAVKQCIDIVKYVCKAKGGNGAIREFVEYILYKVPTLKTISALVCVKLKSSRCPYKNIRRFGNTTLIDNKLQNLLNLSFLDCIIFNTDSQELIDHVKERYSDKITIVKRDPAYSKDEVENYDFCRHVTKDFPSQYVLYSPVTMPFITTHTYREMYDTLLDSKYDSIILAADGKQGGGHTNTKHKICFGASMMSVNDVQLHGDFIGNKPYFQKCNLKERIDIDFPEEFNEALYHEFNKDGVYGSEQFKDMSLYMMDDIANFDENKDKLYTLAKSHPITHKNRIPHIEIIDVTTRDGGFVNNWGFKIEQVEKMLQCASDTNLDYFEIGYLMNADICDPKDGIWRNTDFDIINNIVTKIKPKCKISAMIDYWRYDIDKLLSSNQTKIDLIRVTCYMHKIQEAIDYCKIIKLKGYIVSLNVMCGSYFTNDVIQDIIEKFSLNSHIIDYAYVADTYGAMNPFQVRNIYQKIIPALHKCNIKVGFHIHNNGQIAMANAFEAIECGIDIIDGSYSGMGRGAGNLFLEYLVLYFATHSEYANRKITNKINIEPFLNYIDDTFDDKKYRESIKYAFVGFFNTHPYRLRDFDDNIGMYDLYQAIKEMPKDKKFDYLLK